MTEFPSKKQVVSMMFDSYIKKCCTNELRNIQKQEKQLKSREILIYDYSRINERHAYHDEVLPDFIVKGIKDINKRYKASKRT